MHFESQFTNDQDHNVKFKTMVGIFFSYGVQVFGQFVFNLPKVYRTKCQESTGLAEPTKFCFFNKYIDLDIGTDI